MNEVSLLLGAGGAASARFISEEIVPRFFPGKTHLEDAARVGVSCQSVAVAADSFTVDPPLFPGGNVGSLAVSGSVNDLVMCGAVPRYLTVGLVLAEGLHLSVLRTALDSLAATAGGVGVRVVAGDTKVVSAPAPELIIHAVAIGEPVQVERDYSLENARDGDCIIVTGTVGDHELAVLSAREGLGFDSVVVSDCRPLDRLILPLISRFPGIRAMRDPTRGGLLGVLFDVADATQSEVEVCRQDIPVQVHVRAACEMLGLDPLEMVNEGKAVLIVDEADADGVLMTLRQHADGEEAAMIGQVRGTQSKARVTIREGHRTKTVRRPEGTSTPRLC